MIIHVDSAIHQPVEEARRVFPAAGTNLERLLNDPAFRRDFHARLKTYNPLIVALYRVGLLPFFGAARTVMLLTTRGRNSGKPRCTPIGYFRIGGTTVAGQKATLAGQRAVHVFSAWGRSAGWYKNLAAHPEDVTVQIGLRVWPARAEVLEDPAEVQCTLAQLVSEQPEQARSLFGWDPARDRLENADFSAILRGVLVVRFWPVGLSA